MTFTDDDLKRWETWFEIKAPGSSCDCMNYETVTALLARLEAAERVISNFATEKASPELSNAYIAWRKACGRE